MVLRLSSSILLNIGYCYSNIELLIPKKNRINKCDFFDMVINEEFYKLIKFINEIIAYHNDVRSKYSF